MSERGSLAVASENKGDQFSSNPGQLHLLHPFVVVWLQYQSVTFSKKDMLYSLSLQASPFQCEVLLRSFNIL